MFELIKDIKDLIGRGGWLFLVYCCMLFMTFHTDSIYFTNAFCVFAIMTVPLRRYVDVTVWMLVLFSFFYSFIVFVNEASGSWATFISYIIAPVTFYIFGRYIVDKLKSHDLIFVFLLLGSILFTAVLYGKIIVDISSNGFMNISRDLDIQDDIERSATLHGLNASLGIAGVAAFVMWRKGFSYKWWFMIVSLVLSLTTVLHLVNRTGLVVAVLSFVCTVAYHSRKNVWKIFVPLALCVGAIVLLIDHGIIDDTVFRAYEARNMESDFETGGDRSWRWGDAFVKMWSLPFGWANDPTTFHSYAHNLWFDIARVAGVLPFICFFIATAIGLITFVKLIFKGDNSLLMTYMVAMMVSFLASSFVEPVIEAIPLYFYLFTMFLGVQRQVYIKTKA